MNLKDFEAQSDFAKILNSLDQGIAIFDKDRKLMFINSAMKTVTGGRNVTGWSIKDLIQKHQLRTESGEILVPEKFPIMEAFRGIETSDKIFQYVTINGEHIWISVSCSCILDKTNTVQYVFTTISNISERKSQQDKLNFLIRATKTLSLTMDLYERLQQKARLAVPTLADWCSIDVVNVRNEIERVVVVHRDSKMIDYVAQFEKNFPINPDSPTSPHRVIRTRQAQYIRLITEEMIAGGSSSAEQADAIRALQLKSMMVIPIVSNGVALGCMTLAYAESGRIYSEEDFQFFREFCDHLGILLDNARLYREIKQRDNAKDVFLASLSHELRNPLAPIKTSLELMHLQGIPDDLKSDVETIEHQFDHMTRLIGDLLDVTRYTQAKIPLSKSNMELRSVLGRVIKASEPLARAASISLRHEYLSESIRVEADATRLEQAIMNLVTNAIKFTSEQGSIVITLSASSETAVVTVRDTGRGIDPKDISNVFTMYYQGDIGRDGANPGLGLGLYLVNKIVELHDGSVEARSDGIGHGSEFILRIPIAKNTDSQLSNEMIRSHEPIGPTV